MSKKLVVYVELLDEGTPTLRTAFAIPTEEEGVYILSAGDDYDPEDEDWDFAPGSKIRLKEEPLGDGQVGLVVKHLKPEAVRVYVESEEVYAPPMRNTYAIPVADGLYELQATPHYTPEQQWKFPPGSLVRLKPMKTSFPGWEPLIVTAV